MSFPKLGNGLGLRPPHFNYILEKKPKVDWFEYISENLMGLDDKPGGRPWMILEKIRKDYPVVFHGVSLSIGSVDPIDKSYLSRLKGIVDHFEPPLVSDHLCWTGVNGQNLHDLLPLPYTEEALKNASEKIDQVQEFLGRRIILENVSSYVSYTHSEMKEWEFLSEVSKRTDCGILFDVNNVYVSCKNHGWNADDYLRGIPVDKVAQFHLAGHSNHEGFLIDTHDHKVIEGVWKLYRKALERFGFVNTMIERDDNIPEFQKVFKELEKAISIQEDVLESHSNITRASGVDAGYYHAF